MLVILQKTDGQIALTEYTDDFMQSSVAQNQPQGDEPAVSSDHKGFLFRSITVNVHQWGADDACSGYRDGLFL